MVSFPIAVDSSASHLPRPVISHPVVQTTLMIEALEVTRTERCLCRGPLGFQLQRRILRHVSCGSRSSAGLIRATVATRLALHPKIQVA